MALAAKLEPYAGEILGRWTELIFATYPREGADFLAREKDRFANPVGHTIRRAASRLLDAVLGDADREATAEALDALVRIRSVQDFQPSEAIGIFFLLKDAIRDIAGELVDGAPAADREELQRRIDRLALAAFDTFMACREQLFEVRLHERDRWNAVARRRLQRAQTARSGPGAPEKEVQEP